METGRQTDYQAKCAHLCRQAKILWHSNSQTIGLNKTTSNLFRKQPNNQSKLNVSSLNGIIDIDILNGHADIEAMATYEDIVDALLPFGMMPTVVPELKTITIGGALAGIGIESSSFRYGLVHETVLEFDVLLSNGSLITCSPTNQYADLFFAFPNLYATLGYATRVRIKLHPVSQFVKLTHLKFKDYNSAIHAMQRHCSEDSLDFIDGVIFSANEIVITLGQCVDTAADTSDYTYLNSYYQSIRTKQEDYLTIADYIWRWDTDWFWCSKIFGLQYRILRRLFGRKRLNSRTYSAMMRFAEKNKAINLIRKIFSAKKEWVIQDTMVPVSQAQPFFAFFDQHIGIKPIWMCPVKAYNATHQFPFFNVPKNELFINFGYWDAVKQKTPGNYHDRLIEAKVKQLNGFKSLYSNVHYTKEEFWQIYNQDTYQELKKKYDPQHKLKDWFNKVT